MWKRLENWAGRGEVWHEKADRHSFTPRHVLMNLSAVSSDGASVGAAGGQLAASYANVGMATVLKD